MAGNSKKEIAFIKSELIFKIRNEKLGPANVMLGIEIEHDRTNPKIFVSQSEYTKGILDRFRMSDSKHGATPMYRYYLELLKQESDFVTDVPYRQMIGSMMYLMIGSRPDFVFMIGKL